MMVQVVMTPFGKPYELLRLAGQRKEPLAPMYRNGGIPHAMHDQERGRHSRNTLIRAKLIPDQPAYRQDRERCGGNICNRGVRRFKNEFSDWLICRQGDGN